MLSKDSRRKLSVQVTGAKEKSALQTASVEATAEAATVFTAADASAVASTDGAAAADDTSAGAATQASGDVERKPEAVERVQVIEDIWGFKRSQMLYPSVK